MTLIHISVEDCEFTFTLTENVERVVVHHDLSVSVVGFGSCERVISDVEGSIAGYSASGVPMYAKTAPAYLAAAEKQGIPVSTAPAMI